MPIEIAEKSTRHSKITGDFAEALTLYWLSRNNFECVRIDHTGIDLLALNRCTRELMGISVKMRSRIKGTERNAVSVEKSDFTKVTRACKDFRCEPYYSIVVDQGDRIRVFLTSMKHLQQEAKNGKDKIHWGMTDAHLDKYRTDPSIMRVEFSITLGNWWPVIQ